ncbi:MAG: hypothetical protein ACI9CF_000938 [Candidatus Omnitrophota bacterium]|jgi:hypothetical protein
MKRLFTAALAIMVVCSSAPMAFADEISDLKREMASLRADYESKIAMLMTQVDSIARKSEATSDRVSNLGSGITTEYVGRQNGPFGKGGLIVREESGFGQVSVGGYMDHEFEDFDNTASTFDQHRWIINIGAELGDRLRFYSEYEIEHGGPDSASVGEAKVEQAWIDYLIVEQFNIRAGAVLVPFGRFNLYHDSDQQNLTQRALVNRDIIPTTWTESGAGIYGEFELGGEAFEDWEFGYEAYVINGLNAGFSDTGMRGARGSLETDNNNNKALVGRLVVSPALGTEIGFSGYGGGYNTTGDDITGIAIDGLFTMGAWELTGEWAHFDVDEPAGSDVANDFDGYSVQLSYDFWCDALDDTFLGRSFDDPKFAIIGRFGAAEISDDSDNGTGDNKEDRFTVGFNYRPVESWVFKLSYQWNDTDNETLEKGDSEGLTASVAMGF